MNLNVGQYGGHDKANVGAYMQSLFQHLKSMERN